MPRLGTILSMVSPQSTADMFTPCTVLLPPASRHASSTEYPQTSPCGDAWGLESARAFRVSSLGGRFTG